MADAGFVGWDLGGAHLKLARVDATGRLTHVRQEPCPLWQGLEQLDAAVGRAVQGLAAVNEVHGLTMTGELADCFRSRAEGVAILVRRFATALGVPFRVFSREGMLDPDAAAQAPEAVGSMNWLATARLCARRVGDGVLLDIGSTTADLVPLQGGEARPRGWMDAERLASRELVYTGVVRTAMAAVVAEVPFAGAWQGVAAEQFATMADVYRLLDALPPDADQMPSADGAGKTPRDSARRLARMLGRDLQGEDLEPWRMLAGYVARAQRLHLERPLAQILSARPRPSRMVIVGAGVGRFLARELAAILQTGYVDFADLVAGPLALRAQAAVCAPAAAVAHLCAGMNREKP